MEHYVCTGECGHVSEHPGACQDPSCNMHGKRLMVCNCENVDHLQKLAMQIEDGNHKDE